MLNSSHLSYSFSSRIVTSEDDPSFPSKYRVFSPPGRDHWCSWRERWYDSGVGCHSISQWLCYWGEVYGEFWKQSFGDQYWLRTKSLRILVWAAATDLLHKWHSAFKTKPCFMTSENTCLLDKTVFCENFRSLLCNSLHNGSNFSKQDYDREFMQQTVHTVIDIQQELWILFKSPESCLC